MFVLLPQAAPAKGDGLGGLTGAPVPVPVLPLPLGKGAPMVMGIVEFEVPVEATVTIGTVAEEVYIGAEVGEEEVIFEEDDDDMMVDWTEAASEVMREVCDAYICVIVVVHVEVVVVVFVIVAKAAGRMARRRRGVSGLRILKGMRDLFNEVCEVRVWCFEC